MSKPLNETILAGLQSQLSMALASDNEERIASLRAEIGAIQRDNALRNEMGLLPGKYPVEIVR